MISTDQRFNTIRLEDFAGQPAPRREFDESKNTKADLLAQTAAIDASIARIYNRVRNELVSVGCFLDEILVR